MSAAVKDNLDGTMNALRDDLVARGFDPHSAMQLLEQSKSIRYRLWNSLNAATHKAIEKSEGPSQRARTHALFHLNWARVNQQIDEAVKRKLQQLKEGGGRISIQPNTKQTRSEERVSSEKEDDDGWRIGETDDLGKGQKVQTIKHGERVVASIPVKNRQTIDLKPLVEVLKHNEEKILHYEEENDPIDIPYTSEGEKWHVLQMNGVIYDYKPAGVDFDYPPKIEEILRERDEEPSVEPSPTATATGEDQFEDSENDASPSGTASPTATLSPTANTAPSVTASTMPTVTATTNATPMPTPAATTTQTASETPTSTPYAEQSPSPSPSVSLPPSGVPSMTTTAATPTVEFTPSPSPVATTATATASSTSTPAPAVPTSTPTTSSVGRPIPHVKRVDDDVLFRKMSLRLPWYESKLATGEELPEAYSYRPKYAIIPKLEQKVGDDTLARLMPQDYATKLETYRKEDLMPKINSRNFYKNPYVTQLEHDREFAKNQVEKYWEEYAESPVTGYTVREKNAATGEVKEHVTKAAVLEKVYDDRFNPYVKFTLAGGFLGPAAMGRGPLQPQGTQWLQ